jgi:hypothetical protein
MAPVAVSSESPLGSPVTDQVKVAPGWVSVALSARAEMAVPETLDLLPGLATDTAPDTVQVKSAAPIAPRLSVAVRVTS